MTDATPVRLDYRVIAKMVPKQSRVLDLGCGNGELMEFLRSERDARVQGVDLNEQSIYDCVAKGLSVVHSDLDNGLHGFPDQCFDVVILNQSLQQVRHIDLILQEAFRVGKRVIVGFPNFAVLRARVSLFFNGRAPVTSALPHHWYDTPNLRFLSIRDFKRYCYRRGITILRACYLGAQSTVWWAPNWRAENAVFLISKDPQDD